MILMELNTWSGLELEESFGFLDNVFKIQSPIYRCMILKWIRSRISIVLSQCVHSTNDSLKLTYSYHIETSQIDSQVWVYMILNNYTADWNLNREVSLLKRMLSTSKIPTFGPTVEWDSCWKTYWTGGSGSHLRRIRSRSFDLHYACNEASCRMRFLSKIHWPGRRGSTLIDKNLKIWS